MLRISGIKRSIRTVAVFAAAVVAGALFASLPVTIDGGSFDLKIALAVGQGNGNGGVGSDGQGRGDTNGSLGGNSSDLGSLNAARADTQAFLNANPDSTIGNLAEAYEDLMAYLDAVAAKQAYLDGLGEDPPDEGTLAALDADIATAVDDATDALMDAANKDGLIDGDVVDAVATLMDGKLD